MKAPCTFVLRHFLSPISSMSYCAFLQLIAEMNLDSTCGHRFATSANALTTEQIFLSLLSRDHVEQRIAYGLPCSSREENVGCVFLEILRGLSRAA